MESPYVHDDQLEQEFVAYSSPVARSCHEWIPTMSQNESYGSNCNPLIRSPVNQDSFLHQSVDCQWHTGFPLDHNCPMSTELQLSSAALFPNPPISTSRHHHFNHTFPSTNIPSSNFCSTLFPSSLGLNLKASNLLSSTYNGENTSTKKSSNGVTNTKRPGSISGSKESHADIKKCRSSMARSPSPTLKVRKEKLGDRIAALQKLVAPFGKTDTASVLTEAIGYIQFLHDQVETLTVPYMNSSHKKPSTRMQVASREGEGEGKELKPDLRSRGLCLVPQPCASYFIHSYSSSNI
ncbi:hypothetical protein SLEP1_g12095 [Rubroshorea leprosula]|nr:hypothetical protein SLEP1_g12095 [Rubroshorea leprosula]